MKYVDPCDRTVLFGTGGLQAPIIYVIDLPYHPFEVGAAETACRPSSRFPSTNGTTA